MILVVDWYLPNLGKQKLAWWHIGVASSYCFSFLILLTCIYQTKLGSWDQCVYGVMEIFSSSHLHFYFNYMYVKQVLEFETDMIFSVMYLSTFSNQNPCYFKQSLYHLFITLLARKYIYLSKMCQNTNPIKGYTDLYNIAMSYIRRNLILIRGERRGRLGSDIPFSITSHPLILLITKKWYKHFCKIFHFFFPLNICFWPYITY